MRASFIHVADTHLGYEQYGVRERFNDFSRAFWQITQDAVERQVDFMVIAGDLFHKRAIDAMTLIHAIEGLKMLKERNIAVIAIAGNHDRSYYRDDISWLQFLCHQGYIILLTPMMQDGAPMLEPWQEESMQGAYVDLMDGRLRVYGLPWQGAATARSLEGLARALANARAEEDSKGIEYRLVTMHTGVDGIVGRVQGLPTMAHFQPLRQYVNYLALGHVHKPYNFDGWMYNPGSTETCGAEEAQWDDRGYYYVEIDTSEPEHVHHAEHIKSKRRSFVRYDLRVDGLSDPDALYARLEDYCQREGSHYHSSDISPIVQVQMNGTLSFDAGSLDLPRIEEMVRNHFRALYVKIENHTSDQDYIPDEGEIDGRDRSRWHELERRIFEELIGRDNRYQSAKEQWSSVLAELKHKAIDKDEPTEIARYLREKRANLLETQAP